MQHTHTPFTAIHPCDVTSLQGHEKHLWDETNPKTLFYYWHWDTKIAKSVCAAHKRSDKCSIVATCTIIQEIIKVLYFLWRHHSSQHGTFLDPPMLWRCSYYSQPIASISLATLQVDIILKWCVLPKFLWIIHCLQLSSLVCPVRYTVKLKWAFFSPASSQSEGWKESLVL